MSKRRISGAVSRERAEDLVFNLQRHRDEALDLRHGGKLLVEGVEAIPGLVDIAHENRLASQQDCALGRVGVRDRDFQRPSVRRDLVGDSHDAGVIAHLSSSVVEREHGPIVVQSFDDGLQHCRDQGLPVQRGGEDKPCLSQGGQLIHPALQLRG